MEADEVLAGLTDAQRHAVTHPAHTLAVHAGAGTGKTRVLTRRIAHRVAAGALDPRHVLVLTFTRKAAGELAGRLRALGLRDPVAAGTFHGVAYSQLRMRWAERGIRPPSLLDRKVGFVRRLLPPDRTDVAVEIVGEIEWSKARMIPPAQYAAAASSDGRRTTLDGTHIGEAFAQYEEAKRERRLVDFDDLLRLCARDLQNDREFAAAQQWRFRSLNVDEFQDINPLQFALLTSWLGDRDDLTVVGDPNQAIYGWNGADAHYLVDFDHYFPAAETAQLVENHRSTPQVLQASHAVLPSDSVALAARRPDGDPLEIVGYADDDAEAHGIARAVRDGHRPGRPWHSQAVLVRTRAQADLIARALQTAQVPVRVVGATSLVDDDAVKQALKQLAHHGGPFLAAVSDLAADLDEGARADDPLVSLAALGSEYAHMDTNPTVVGFIAWLRDGNGRDRSDGDAVEISTFHAAKGLEWPIVHLAGLEEGLVPIAHARTPDELDEERRLVHVALTRARDRVRCTWAARRTFGTKTVDRSPSPILDELAVATRVLSAVDDDPREHLQDQRAALRSVPTSAGRPARDAAPDEGLGHDDQSAFVALQRWRSETARAAGVPAHVVFHDQTLAAVARRRPVSVDELREIPGIGPVKASRYGPALLRLMSGDRVG